MPWVIGEFPIILFIFNNDIYKLVFYHVKRVLLFVFRIRMTVNVSMRKRNKGKPGSNL